MRRSDWTRKMWKCASTDKWLRYRLPRHLVRHQFAPGLYWPETEMVLLRLVSDTTKIRFDLGDKPEFDHWRWVSYWYPINKVVSFKKSL